MGERRCAYMALVEKSKGRNAWLNCEDNIGLILNKSTEMAWNESICFRLHRSGWLW
jgi:hypothetical protein